jgi:hypothetical protein
MLKKLLIIAFIAAWAPSAFAAEEKNECKGLTKAQAEAKKDKCVWVDGYTKDDGTKVEGYARRKPQHDGAKKEDDKPKKEMKKEEKKEDVKKEDKKEAKKEDKKADKKDKKEDVKKDEKKDDKKKDDKKDKK